MLREFLLVIFLSQYHVITSSPLLKVRNTDHSKTNLGTPTSRSFTTAPLNTAVVSGQSSSLHCASNTSTTLNWFFTPHNDDSSSRVTLVTECILNTDHSADYKVEFITAGECHLGVLAATQDQVGSYECVQSTGTDPGLSAELGVLDAEPSCTYSTQEPVEGQTLTLTCDVSYSENLPQVLMTWTDSQGQPVTSQSSLVGRRYTSWVELTLDSDPVLDQYTCKTNFTEPLNPDTSATNAPDFNHEFTFPALNVLHCPKSISLNATDGGGFQQGDAISCTTDGYPAPEYTWRDEDLGSDVASGRVLVLEELGPFNYTCRSVVTINGTACEITKTIHVVVSSTTRRPQNTAILLGSNETLGCQYGPDHIHWFFVAASQGASAVWIVRDCVVSNDYVPYLAVDSSRGGCDLIIFNAIFFHGGRYTCQDADQTARPSSALVIILESSPVCSVNVSDNTVVEGNSVKYTCSMNFTGALKPQFLWTTSDNDIITNSTLIVTDTHVETYIEIPAYPSTVQSFTCTTYFDAPPPQEPPFLTDPATNRPSYNNTWNSPVLEVLYCPTTVQISPFTSVVFVGDILHCSANGNPNPVFEWENLETGDFFQGANVRITESGSVLYRCTAKSTVDGRICSSSALFIGQAYEEVSPLNQAELRHSQVTFNCRARTQEISWVFAPWGTTSSVTIASGCEVVHNFRDRYEVDSEELACNLVVHTGAASLLAGTYTCQDLLSPELPHSAQLIVLESHPVCLSNATNNTVNVGQPVEFSCTVAFRGNIIPQMSWIDSDGNPVPESSIKSRRIIPASQSVRSQQGSDDTALFNTVLISAIVIVAEGQAIGPYTCMTFFNGPTDPPPEHLRPATNAPPYAHNWTSEVIFVSDGNQCWSAPCQNDGSCENIDNGYICHCTPGHTGTNCESIVEVDPCASNPCKNGAECSSAGNDYTCTCIPGFTGVNCETDIDECQSVPCLNGGECSPGGVNEYICTCLPGYTGVICQTDIDECSSRPCLNGGVCNDFINQFNCTCKPGFSGDLCQTDIDECASSPCENGAQCISGIDEYICICRPGFTGSNCETDIDECASSPCLNGGQCSNGIGDYVCGCLPGFTGKDCETNIDECESAPCQNGGECSSGINDYTCTCLPGYTGVNCQTDIDECESNPCQNGGECSSGINDYTCTCLPGYTGVNCQTDIDECASNPCENGGQCEGGINEYNCTCQPGYEGDNCQIDVDECLSEPCLNGGTCQSGVNDYTCSCPPDATGDHCETDVDLSDCRSSPCQNDGTCVPLPEGYTCDCPPLYTGDHCQTSIHGRLQHCAAIRAEDPTAESGIYVILVASLQRSVAVYCDMTTDGGGWTVIQRRMDGSVEFKQPWARYANGFGDLETEFWLGNEYISGLTADGFQKIRFDMGDFNGQTRYAEFSNFSVADASDRYRLRSLGLYSGTAGDSFSYHNNWRFTTSDQDNDGNSAGNCADTFRSAGWFNNCLRSNPNGEYNNTIDAQGIYWLSWHGPLYSMKFIDMKIRPVEFIPPE